MCVRSCCEEEISRWLLICASAVCLSGVLLHCELLFDAVVGRHRGREEVVLACRIAGK